MTEIVDTVRRTEFVAGIQGGGPAWPESTFIVPVDLAVLRP